MKKEKFIGFVVTVGGSRGSETKGVVFEEFDVEVEGWVLIGLIGIGIGVFFGVDESPKDDCW